jgi:hypothetical protein
MSQFIYTHIENDHLNAYVYTHEEMYRHDIYIYILPRLSLALLVVSPTRRDILYSVPPEALRVAVAGQQHSSE